jgi:DNA-3-methyladenine glycosylase
MFGDPGVAYVYFIYGMYEMLNFVTEVQGRPGAVLVRALEPVLGEETMARRRKKIRLRTDLTSGPGKLCRAMGIEMRHNGMSLGGPELRVIDDGFTPRSVSASARVGISRATDRMWRFFITDHPFVSRVPQNREARVLRNWR